MDDCHCEPSEMNPCRSNARSSVTHLGPPQAHAALCQLLTSLQSTSLPKPFQSCLQLMCALACMGLDLLKSGRGGLSTLICMTSCSSKDAE